MARYANMGSCSPRESATMARLQLHALAARPGGGGRRAHSWAAPAPQYGMTSSSVGSRNRNSLCAGRLYVMSCSSAIHSKARLRE